ncbi:hypothetical protein IC615_27400 [Serratia ureilytica]
MPRLPEPAVQRTGGGELNIDWRRSLRAESIGRRTANRHAQRRATAAVRAVADRHRRAAAFAGRRLGAAPARDDAAFLDDAARLRQGSQIAVARRSSAAAGIGLRSPLPRVSALR